MSPRSSCTNACSRISVLEGLSRFRKFSCLWNGKCINTSDNSQIISHTVNLIICYLLVSIGLYKTSQRDNNESSFHWIFWWWVILHLSTDGVDTGINSDMSADAVDYEAESWSLTVEHKFCKKQDKRAVKRQDVIYGELSKNHHNVSLLKIRHI